MAVLGNADGELLPEHQIHVHDHATPALEAVEEKLKKIEVTRLRVEPGELVIVYSRECLSADTACKIRETLEERLRECGWNNSVAVLAGGLSLCVLRGAK